MNIYLQLIHVVEQQKQHDIVRQLSSNKIFKNRELAK